MKILIIHINRSDQAALHSRGLYRAEQIDGIELNQGDDDFGDELLSRLPGKGSIL